MGDDSPAEGGADGAGAAGGKGSTTAGAALLMGSPWLTVAAAAVYTTNAMWAKLREMGIFKSLRGRKAAAVAAAAAAAGGEASSKQTTDEAVLKLFHDEAAAINSVLLQDQEEADRGPDRTLEMSPIGI